MGYAIMRAAKLGGMGKIATAIAHNNRSRETPNADEEKRRENEIIEFDRNSKVNIERYIQSDESVFKKFRENLSGLDKAPRKDSVKMVEFVITASPDFFENNSKKIQDEFFKDSIKWIGNEFGRDNIVSAVIHRDEKTPHMHVLLTPIREKEVKYTNRVTKETTVKKVKTLDAKHYFDGSAKLSEMQTRYHKSISQHGLERGIKGKISRHTAVKTFYGVIDPGFDLPNLEIPKKGLLESQSKWEKELKESLQDQLSPTWRRVTFEAEKKAEEVPKLQSELAKERQDTAKFIAEKSREIDAINTARALAINAEQQKSAKAKEEAEKLKAELERAKAEMKKLEQDRERVKDFLTNGDPAQIQKWINDMREEDRQNQRRQGMRY